jgi:16S rRNA (uracil1498-N3)-methyltransferase
MRHTFRYVLAQAPVPGAHVTLSPGDSHHLTRVVRRRAGDGVEVIDPEGRIWPATVVEPGDPATVRVAAAPRPAPAQAPVTLLQGLADWGRLDVLVEKCAELGVARVALVAGARARRVPAPDAWRRRRERLLRVAEAAARQSGRPRLPEVDGVLSWEEALEAATAAGDAYLLDPGAGVGLPAALAAREDPARPVALLVGGDTGFGEDEVALATARGVTACSLGAGVLRAETAALVGVSLALSALGCLDGDDVADPMGTTTGGAG